VGDQHAVDDRVECERGRLVGELGVVRSEPEAALDVRAREGQDRAAGEVGCDQPVDVAGDEAADLRVTGDDFGECVAVRGGEGDGVARGDPRQQRWVVHREEGRLVRVRR
jgi:hypothetical protein